MSDRRIRVALRNDYEVVVQGLLAMLSPHADRVHVVELDSGVPVISDVDVVLYDTFSQQQADGQDLDDLIGASSAKVVVYSWNLQRELVAAALRKGASGYLSKTLQGADLLEALERVHAGEIVTSTPPGPDAETVGGDWPGRAADLTVREAEVLALITQGFSNQEIAERAYISINSVKTYIRTCYRKIGVTSRSQALIWGMGHGFEPDHLRVLPPRTDGD